MWGLLLFMLGFKAEHGDAALMKVQARGIVSPSNRELLINTLCFGIPTLFIFSIRILNATWLIKKMRIDDYLMCVTICVYITLLVLINVSAHYATNLFPHEQLAAITADPQDVANRRFGSIIVIPLEQCMLLSTWLIKMCVWLFLNRLCRQVVVYQRWLRWLMYYMIVGYVTIMLTYYVFVCRPFSEYWAVPPKNAQCATYQHYSIVQMVFNVTSDIALIVIPCIMFAHTKLPLKRKLVLIAVFSLAIFTITAAILNKAYNFASPWTTTYALWYIREASVAVFVANLVCCWQIVQKTFKARSFDNQHANIVAQPELAPRAPVSNDHFTRNGTPKTKSWWDRRIARRIAHGSLGSLLSSKRTTTTNSSSGVLGEEMDPQKAQQNVKGNANVTLMSMQRGEDDARPAIAYRAENDIV